MIAGTSSLTFAWPPPEGEIIAHYDIVATYVGDCPEIGSLFTGNSASNFLRTTVEFTDLQEFSNYSLSVTAVNGSESSETSTLVVTTLPAGESHTHAHTHTHTHIVMHAKIYYVCFSSQWTSTEPNSHAYL